MNLLRPLASLQARLLTLVLGLVAIVWLGAAAATWYDASHELDELLDGHLAQAAAFLVVLHAGEGDVDDVVDAPSVHKYAPSVAFQVFHEGRLTIRSSNATTTPMSSVTNGFETVRLTGGAEWRVFATRGANSDVQVYVGERIEMRSDILRSVLHSVLWPLFVALPLLALAAWWAVRQGLVPLRELSRVLDQRRAQSVEPLVLDHAPLEMLPLVKALNQLFERIDGMVESERRFTADAAHELRTPIAAIRAQAQVAMGAGADAAQRQHALRATLAGCDRATRLVDQLLTLSRLEAAPTVHVARLDLSALTRSVAAELAPAALARQQNLELEAPVRCDVAGDEMLVGVLVRNLLDNAMRYSPEGTTIRIKVSLESGATRLQLHDSGAGMSDEQMARLGERFYRVLGTDQPGSGLGWSIVRRIAQVHGAQVDVTRSTTLGGLAVTVSWPRTSVG